MALLVCRMVKEGDARLADETERTKCSLTIRYGKDPAYTAETTRVAEELLDALAERIAAIDLIPEESPIFQILYETEVLFDQAAEGRLPNPGEVAGRLQVRLGETSSQEGTHPQHCG